MTKYGGEWISSTWILYGHHVCKNANGDSLTEVCSRKISYHKVDKDEHAIDVDNFPWCLTFNEEYKMTEIGPDVSWQPYIHGLTYNYCSVGACDGQG